ncbi:MAG: EAL domain-containing protein [Treponema sp.]|nr:EAL domain-containing protein [Treponema sp.]
MNDYLMFDITALLIFLTLMVSNLSKNKVKGRTGQLYDALLVWSCIMIVFRVAYQIILRHCPYSPAIVTVAKVFVYLTLLFRTFVYCVGLLFIFSSTGLLPLFLRNETLKIILILLFNIPILYVLMDVVRNIMFEITPQMELITLPPMMVLEICILVQLFFGFVMILWYRKVLTKTQVSYGVSLFPLNGLLFAIQILYPQIQIEMFVLAITCYLIFATIQRPELLMNSQTLAQSSIAFENELKKAMRINLDVKVIFIKIVNYKHINMYIGTESFYSLLKKVTFYLHNLSVKNKLHASIYYLNDYLYALPTEGQSDESINKILNTLEKYFSQTFFVENAKINIATRICVIRTPEDVTSYENMLYVSRIFHRLIENTGVPQWYRDYSSDKNFIIKNNIEKILERAIEEKRFDVYYQPIYNVKTKEFSSAEALVRLNDEEFGNIPPSMFINFAERTNKIHIIGDFVLEKVCEFLGSKEGQKLKLDYIEVNLSVAQCLESDIVEKIRGWLEAYNIKPEQLRLEITENAASFNPVVVEKNISQLKQMGINFALDDYGTGYSNIKKVVSLPFDVVKLNKTFVDEVDDPDKINIVKDTIHMLKSLGKEILIEGIETQERAELFKKYKIDKKNGCEYLQGFYFSRPLPQSEFVKFLTM